MPSPIVLPHCPDFTLSSEKREKEPDRLSCNISYRIFFLVQILSLDLMPCLSFLLVSMVKCHDLSRLLCDFLGVVFVYWCFIRWLVSSKSCTVKSKIAIRCFGVISGAGLVSVCLGKHCTSLYSFMFVRACARARARVCVCVYGAVVCAVDFKSKHCGFDPR